MSTPLTFNWSNFNGDISGGVSQDTGGINVDISYANDGNATTSVINSDTQFVDTAAGETFASNSSLEIRSSGGVGNTSTTSVNFSSVSGSGFSDEVDNVTFRINDFDTGDWVDVVTVRAFDADGNAITVELDWNGSSVSGVGPTLTSDVANGSAASETGSILVTIAGPVAFFEIDYDNDASGGQALWITDVHFDAVGVPDGTVSGTSGDDIIDDTYEGDPERDMVDNNDAILAGDTGNDDLIEAGAGDDIVLAGDGDDLIYAADGNDSVDGGAGDDIIYGDGDAPAVINGDFSAGGTGWSGNDLEFNPENTYQGNGVNNGVTEVNGNANQITVLEQNLTVTTGGTSTLSFDGLLRNTPGQTTPGIDGFIVEVTDENGTVILSETILPTSITDWETYEFEVNFPDAGIYSLSFTEIGGTDSHGALLDNVSFVSDAGADTLDGGAGDDVIYGHGGNDDLDGGADDDEVFGGQGSDNINVSAGEGTDTIFGGEDADGTDIDTLTFTDGTGIDGVDIVMTDNEDGTYAFPTDGGDGTFSDIENFVLTAQDDNFDGTVLTDGTTIEAGAGDDNIIGGSGDDVFDGGADTDFLSGGEGDDTLYGGEGDDAIILGDNFGNDVIEGGETGEAIGDVLDASAITSDVTVDLSAIDATDGESGTITDGIDTATFGEIEIVQLGSGDDSIIGSSGDDFVGGGTGADTFDLGGGDDTIDLGIGLPVFGGPNDGDNDADTVVLQDGSGNDTIFSFDAPTDNGDGTFTGTDVFDVTGLNGTEGVPVNTNDVTVTDDGAGNALLTFPNGESVTLNGISPTDADDPFYLNAIGIPLLDGTVSGTSGDDEIIDGYTGDPDGDMVDNGDAIITGDVDDDDLIEAGAGNDTIQAGEGDDLILAADGDDSVDGGDGDDIIYGDGDSPAVINGDFEAGSTGWSGTDTEFNSESVYQGNGVSNGVTEINGGSNNTTVLEQDITIASGGTATLSFDSVLRDSDQTTTGIDGFVVEITDDSGKVIFSETILPASKIDWATYEFEVNFQDEGIYSLSFTEVGGNDSFGALLDNVSFASDAGDDTLDGGAGDDVIYGHGGDDHLDGGADNDEVFGGQGSDEIDVTAGEGNDTIVGGEDADGLDVDTLDFDDTVGTDGVDVTLTGDEEGTYTFPTDGGDGTFSEIEAFDLTEQDDTFDGASATNGSTVDAGAGDDTITGGNGDDVFDGGDGDDSLFGDNGTDIVDGGLGDDYIDGGFGTDVLDGGDGNDTVSYLQSFGNPGNETLDLDLETGTAILNGSEVETATNFENAISGNTSDTITGTSGANMIDSGGNDDTIDGAAGDDTLFAGAGDDEITGGEGRDTIFAGSGDDTVTFSEGDTIDGGAGDDTIVLEDLGETGNGTITLTGGAGDETGGDTLQLGSLGVLTQSVRDTFTDDGTGSFSGSITLDDGTILNFSEIENIICFTPGTRIATPNGLVAIEDLKIGDLVVTRDHGLQPIRWLEGRKVPAVDRFAPVRIRKNVLAGQDRDLIVSPQHRVLFQGYRAELLFGESEVLVAAKHLVDGMDVTQNEQHMVTYIHMMFDRHEIIYAEGAATESFHPGDIGINAVSDQARDELFTIFPELRADPSVYGNTARRCLKSREAKLIRC